MSYKVKNGKVEKGSKSGIKWSDTLPETEGSVFVAHLPGAPFFVLGRRWKGKLYPGEVFAGSRRADEILMDCLGRGLEFVQGREADELISAIDAYEKAKRPLCLFIRNHEVEAEVGIELAGTLYVDSPKDKIDQKFISKPLEIIKNRDLGPNETLFVWPDRRGALYSDAITENAEIMDEWSKRCTVIKVRSLTGDGEIQTRPDSEMLRDYGLAKDGSRLQ